MSNRDRCFYSKHSEIRKRGREVKVKKIIKNLKLFQKYFARIFNETGPI